MRGDQTQSADGPGAESRERKGPRHAAPRKSLLTKLQIPAGKAMALAAMPGAVLVGMGVAPRLALADEKDIPFAPGPCVTRSDEPVEPEERTEPSAKPEPSKSAKPKTRKATSKPEPKETERPQPDVSPDARSNEEPPTADSVDEAAQDSADGSTTRAGDRTAVGDLLDPVDPSGTVQRLADGVGGAAQAVLTATLPSEEEIRKAARDAGVAVEDLPEEVKKTETTPKNETGEKRAGEADEAQDSQEPEGSKKSTSEKSTSEKSTSEKSTSEKSGAEQNEAQDDKAQDDKAEKVAKKKAAEEDEEAKSPDAKKEKDGKEPFPCPTHDAKALAEAELEPGAPLLPDEPWHLDSSLLTLYGLDYHGIVEVKTGSGKIKKVLKFTASSVDIKDLYQKVEGGGRTAHLKARSGSTSTIRGGTVTMYTEELKGNLFGLIPVTFSPQTPPPLNVPFAFFTHAKVTQAGQFGGNLTVPGLKNWIA
ncbi:hypothetical protein [Streptomyces sp. NPDC006879]|uniref:hypothetical protein n=1 Tax=Streptomyces sp. NPDC006879 TaxID=3364767 RepID=UPI0036CB6C43